MAPLSLSGVNEEVEFAPRFVDANRTSRGLVIFFFCFTLWGITF